jgi:hypothetical protein
MPTTATYSIPYPGATEQANVPQDMNQLASKVDVELGKKLATSGAITSASQLQTKIIVRTLAQGPPATGINDGDVVFLI